MATSIRVLLSRRQKKDVLIGGFYYKRMIVGHLFGLGLWSCLWLWSDGRWWWAFPSSQPPKKDKQDESADILPYPQYECEVMWIDSTATTDGNAELATVTLHALQSMLPRYALTLNFRHTTLAHSHRAQWLDKCLSFVLCDLTIH